MNTVEVKIKIKTFVYHQLKVFHFFSLNKSATVLVFFKFAVPDEQALTL